MSIKTLKQLGQEGIYLLGVFLTGEPGYRDDVNRGLPFFKSHELNEMEKKYDASGMTFEDIEAAFARKGMILKAPTFKKYVGCGLIPGTDRIIRKTKRNVGFYPAEVLRSVNTIKYVLYRKVDPRELLRSAILSYECSLQDVAELDFGGFLAIDGALDDAQEQVTHTTRLVREAVEKGFLPRKKGREILGRLTSFQKACERTLLERAKLEKTMRQVRVPTKYVLSRILDGKPG